MSSFAESVITKLRNMLARKNERGIKTTDIFRLKVREEIRRQLSGKQGLVIDIGCGEGYLLENALGDGNLKAVLFDNEDWMLKKVVNAYFPRLAGHAFPVQGDAGTLPFSEGAFDYAVCISTFLSFPGREEVERAIREIGRILRPGGSLFFDVRNRNNPLVKLLFDNVQKYDSSLGQRRLKAYSLKETSDILQTSGFRLTKSVGMFIPFKQLSPIIIVAAEKM